MGILSKIFTRDAAQLSPAQREAKCDVVEECRKTGRHVETSYAGGIAYAYRDGAGGIRWAVYANHVKIATGTE